MIAPILVLAALAAEIPEARYVVKVVTRSWEPILVQEIEPLVEAKVLARISEAGLLRLSKSSYSDLGTGDYQITIDGRFVEEAEAFSIYVGFGKAKRSDIPSFHIAESAALEGSRAQMVSRIESAADRAGRRITDLLRPRLEAIQRRVTPPPLEDAKLPYVWGSIDVPEVKEPSLAMRNVLDVAQPDHVRLTAITTLKGYVFDQQAARNTVERCVLFDPSPEVRTRCAEALAPSARSHVPTQRVLLAAMRSETDERVLEAIGKLAQSFPGLSMKEVVATWLEMVASDRTPPSAARKAAQDLSREDDVPNLELAVGACLQQEALVYGKRQACADTLLKKIPEGNRLLVAWQYLNSVRDGRGGERSLFEAVLEHVAGPGDKPLSPELAELLLEIAESPRAGAPRRLVLYPLRRHPFPAKVVDRLVRLLPEPTLATDVIRTIDELCRESVEIREPMFKALLRARERVEWLVRPAHENPYDALDKLIARLEAKNSPR